MGDLSGLKSRDNFKARYDQAYPGKSTGHVAVSAGQLYRFVHAVKLGDLVIYPSQVTRQVNLALSPATINIGQISMRRIPISGQSCGTKIYRGQSSRRPRCTRSAQQ